MAFLAAIPAAIGLGGGAAAAGGGLSLGSLIGAAGTVVSGVAGLAAANYSAKVAEQNAAIARENAERATQRSQEQVLQSDNEIAAFIGEQEAAQSASGLSTQGRSQLLTRRAAQRLGRQDSRNIIESGRADARGFLQQQADFKGQASQSRRAGLFNAIGAGLGAAGSLIGTNNLRSPTANRLRNDPWNGLRVRTV